MELLYSLSVSTKSTHDKGKQSYLWIPESFGIGLSRCADSLICRNSERRRNTFCYVAYCLWLSLALEVLMEIRPNCSGFKVVTCF